MMNRIYLDHAATTPVSAQVLEAMMPFFNSCWGNASSVYGTGREARKAVEKHAGRLPKLSEPNHGKSCSPAAEAKVITWQ